MDAYAIGANDVANSFSTAVASKTITLRTAVIIALFAGSLDNARSSHRPYLTLSASTFAEFGGAVLLGKSTADTIRSGVANLSYYTREPEILMLGMWCALVGSSTTLLVATRFGLPISTTHAIVGGVIGISVASAGPTAVYWGWDGFTKIAG
jgi:sodium-dependent phosphate transporter